MNRCVVVIDGNNTWRELSVRLLTSEGYQTRSFCDSVQAMNYLRTNRHSIIVADYNWIKAERSRWTRFVRNPEWNGRLVLLLSSRNPGLARECFKLGANDCALKPRDERSLSMLVKNVMHLSFEPWRKGEKHEVCEGNYQG
jgi:FixJ family two-component response regulator